MAHLETIKAVIDTNINANGNQAITGGVLNSVLKQSVEATQEELSHKQDVLKDGENVKTINGQSLLGKGNITISGGGGGGGSMDYEALEFYIPLQRQFSDDFSNDFAR